MRACAFGNTPSRTPHFGSPMRRSIVRLTILVLALLGAPLATHVLIHDLGDHPEPHHSPVMDIDGAHGGHEHPVTASSSPQIARAAVTVPVLLPASMTESAEPAPTLARDRNVIAFGALRLDDDVGAQALLSTFRI